MLLWPDLKMEHLKIGVIPSLSSCLFHHSHEIEPKYWRNDDSLGDNLIIFIRGESIHRQLKLMIIHITTAPVSCFCVKLFSEHMDCATNGWCLWRTFFPCGFSFVSLIYHLDRNSDRVKMKSLIEHDFWHKNLSYAALPCMLHVFLRTFSQQRQLLPFKKGSQTNMTKNVRCLVIY